MAAGDAALAAVLKRDRAIVLASLLAITGLAWVYISWLAAGMAAMPPGMPDMPDMPDMVSSAFAPWDLKHFLFIFAMWAVMMVGMMIPSAAPMILIYLRVGRQSEAAGRPFAPAVWFTLGYLLVWTSFALTATGIQYGLERIALLTPMMAGTSRVFGGVVLIAVGVFQWTPIKEACLSQCRAPLSFVQRHGGFKASASGSLRLGVMHGGFCVGCCWAIMALLFVVGVMNLLWIAAIMIFVLFEKVLPSGQLLARAAGATAVAVGVWELVP